MPRSIIVTPSMEYTQFCSWLKKKINGNKELTYEVLEEHLGIAHSTFSHRINEVGNSEWTLKDYLKLLDYFDAKPEDIFR